MGSFIHMDAFIYDMGIESFNTGDGNGGTRNMRSESDVQEAISNSDALIKDYEARSGSYSCKCVCKNCSSLFWKGVSRIERGDGSYCCIECSSESRKGEAQLDLDLHGVDIYYISGLIYGDGHIRHIEETGNYNVTLTNTSMDVIESFKRSVDNIGGTANVSTSVRDDKNHSDCYTAKVSSIQLYKFMKNNMITPQDVSSNCSTESEKVNFLRGFYEAEGSIQKYRMRISQKDKDILKVISRFITDIAAIEPNIREYNKEYHNLVVQNRSDIKKLILKLDPVIKRGDFDG